MTQQKTYNLINSSISVGGGERGVIETISITDTEGGRSLGQQAHTSNKTP